MTRVLIVKTSSMGDVVHNLPVVADLRRHRPDHVIDWMVEEAYADLVRMTQGVARVIPVAWRRWRRSPGATARLERRAFHDALRRERYDVVLDTQGLVKSAWLARGARLAPGGVRAGFSFGLAREGLARLFYDRGYAVDPRLHAIERMRALAAAAFGYGDRPLGPPRFPLVVPPAAFDWLPSDGAGRPAYAVLLHATARVEKAWPAGHWAGLIDALGAAGLVCVLPSGTTAERAQAVALVERAGTGNAAFAAPPLALPQVAALLAGARVVVGVDTGLLHLAAALDVPLVGLFGATPRWRYAPYWSGRAIGLGDFDERRGEVRQPSLEAVLEALRELGVGSPPTIVAAAHG